MRLFRKYVLPISLVLTAIGLITEITLLSPKQQEVVVSRFEEELHEKQALVDQRTDWIIASLEEGKSEEHIQSIVSELTPFFSSDGIGFLISRNRDLVYWSDNHFSFSNANLFRPVQENLLLLPNGYYLQTTKRYQEYTITGLILLKDEYSIKNEYMENNFSEHFNVPENYSIQEEQTEKSLPIYDTSGNYLFSLLAEGTIYCSTNSLYIPSFLFALSILFLMYYLRLLFIKTRHYNFILRISTLGIILLGIYCLHILFGFPSFCSAFELFSPTLYAYSQWLPSLGDLFFLSALIFLWSLNFSKEFKFSKKKRIVELFSAYTFVGLFYLFINFLIRNMIRNSSFSFQLNNIDDINLHSIVGYLIIALLLYSVFIVNLKIVESSREYINEKRFFRIHLILIIAAIVSSIIFQETIIYIICLFLLINFSIIALEHIQLKRFSLNYLIFFVSIFSFFALIIIQNHNNAKRENLQKLMAITLNSEQDPAAVAYLTDIQQQINEDERIQELLYTSYSNLEQYLEFQYFNSYFRDYDLQITICEATDSLTILPDNQQVLCFPFFEEMIENSGSQITGTNFYHLDNMNGRISYLGKFFYPTTSETTGISIFIDLQSKLQSEGEGFPELLLDESHKKPDSYQHFSYAKFYNNNLVNLSGDYKYNYDFYSNNLDTTGVEFSFSSRNEYDHLVYSLGENNYIVVSGKTFTTWDYLISYPYLFVFLFVFSLLVVLATSARYRKNVLVSDLRFRIQVAIIGVVLVTLLIVSVGTIYYNISNYNQQHEEDLSEKITSILEEINRSLNYENGITNEIQNWLWDELIELSNIFKTDINIYSTNGELLASSRPEIFNHEIISTRMNPKALYELNNQMQLNYVQPEEIGNLSFLSVYEPIINYSGNYIGYINLPYFSHQNEMRQEITTFIVAFLNLYVLLFFISVVIAVFLSNQITRPLTMVREKLKGIQLNKKNEQIIYNRDDEIGALVNEYNRKVEELADSAELLAQNEREMAWREMAKQVAHEIKNPLTPMKLNIQYLQKKKSESSDDYDEFFNRVTRSLIEQIDTLSSIATEFSNFAKIPNAKNEVFNLSEKLKQVTDLYKASKTMDLQLEINLQEEVLIFADPDQFSRAIINLIKNAIQSVPPRRKAEIRVALTAENQIARISISDNGSGIQENIRQQLFQPNFTTKSSGMGLGLAIVKKIIETCKGRIWFDSVIDQGTIFYIEIPIYTEPTDDKKDAVLN